MAQEFVGTGQVMEFLAADVPLVMQLLQREQGASGPQPGLRTSVYALQTLHQKLDIPNAASIDFYVDGLVWLRQPDRLLPPRLHFFPRHQRSLDGRKIYFLGIDMRLHGTDKFARQASVSGRIFQLDQRLPFPVMRGFRVVGQCVGQGNSKFTLAVLRPEAQIDTEDGSFARDSREDLGGVLRQPDKVFAVRNRRPGLLFAVAVDVHQVYVRAVVQFVAAQL